MIYKPIKHQALTTINLQISFSSLKKLFTINSHYNETKSFSQCFNHKKYYVLLRMCYINTMRDINIHTGKFQHSFKIQT